MLLDLLRRALDFVTAVMAELVGPLEDPCPHESDGGECEEPECQ